MGQISFFARGDSNTANNASLNVVSTNQTPTTLLTFDDFDGAGDLDFDIFASGASDPDTRVYLNGDTDTPLSFTVVFKGQLPGSQRLSAVGNPPNTFDLRGAEVTVIVLETGERLFIVTDDDPAIADVLRFDASVQSEVDAAFAVMNAFPNGAFALTNLEVCYAEGTLIATPEGPRPVETLAAGDLVSTLDDGPVVVRMVVARRILARDMALFDTLRPVTLPAGLLGAGRPSRDLTVTPLHRILIDDPDLERLFGEARMYCHARDVPGIRRPPARDMTFVHVICDTHAVLVAEGAPSESLYPGDVALLRLPDDQRRRVMEIVGARAGKTAHPSMTGTEAAVWRNAVQSREKRAFCTGVQETSSSAPASVRVSPATTPCS